MVGVRVGSFNRLGNAQRVCAAETRGPLGTRLNDGGCTRWIARTAWATPSALGAAETRGPLGTRLNDGGRARWIVRTAWATPSAVGSFNHLGNAQRACAAATRGPVGARLNDGEGNPSQNRQFARTITPSPRSISMSWRSYSMLRPIA
ncbi:hypothetical protein K227x_41960 [Rubripirellula lacrimiformis]|uniref:Uncharacterized protein n=1 Tax=Rubripirellula lacrimiformis TaxID=1930273 RepID=A0A517NF81_9BACT|nr:hypothetical protein K227x_41960 [Rubripirellula lacrimiformis]